MSRPIRQSSRLSAKQNQVSTITVAAPPPRPNKRQKTTPQASAAAKPSVPRVDDFRKVKGRRGKLRRLMTEIPVDTLLEIFSHVEPLDLLHLSWATKDLHALITASRNAFLWTRAYENLQSPRPPPCPPGKNVAQFTNLLFGRACQYCGTNHVGKIIHWAGQVRLCSQCARDKLLPLWGPGVDQEIASPCASEWISNGSLQRTCYIMKSDYERHKQKFAQCKDHTERMAYKVKAHAERQETFLVSQLYGKWYRSQDVNRLPMAEITRRKRRDAIIAKLQHAGYAAELQQFSINFLPIVRVPAELTEKAWDKMKDELIDLMEYKRQEMLKTNITRALQLRLYTLDRTIRSTTAQHLIVPHTSYIAALEPFKTLLKTLPLEERFTEAQMSTLATPDTILRITEAWRREADISLLGLLSKPLPSSADEAIDRTPLELATTFFKCNWCTEPINYPRILMHQCLRNRCPKDTDEEEDQEGDDGKVDSDSGSDDEVEAIEAEDDNEHQTRNTINNEVTVDSVWNKMSSWFGSDWNEGNDQIFVDEEATNFAKTIVEACGEDPNTTTFTRMEELDARLECLRCTAKSKAKTRNRLVMNWTTALLHDIEIHFEDTSNSAGWKLLTDEADISATAESEAKMGKKWRSVNRKCNRCDCFIGESYLKSHLHIAHKLNLGEDEDGKQNYHLPLDTPLKRAPLSVRI